MSGNEVKHLLIAPLDWGFGHTTRCVPLIRYLLRLGHKVSLAGNNAQLSFYKSSFPQCDLWPLDGYNIHYGRNALSFAPLMMRQIPKILRTIRKEHDWLWEKIIEHDIDGVISDNRYGLHHPTVPCIIITHQLSIMTGMGGFANSSLRRLHYSYLRRFSCVWVADHEAGGLAGNLAKPAEMPPRHEYLGLLSQFDANTPAEETDGSLLILLSGPEPQRSILSALLWRQALTMKQQIVFVEGSDTAAPPVTIPAHIAYHGRLLAEELLPLIKKAAVVVCRSGYSTLMELALLRKKAIVIPTPGQTEQEYLAKYTHNKKWFCGYSQKDFNLQKALQKAADFPFVPYPNVSDNDFIPVLYEWLNDL